MKIDQNILIRYFLNQVSEEEKEAIHQWIDSDPANKNEFIHERIRFDASLLVDRKEINRTKEFHISRRVYEYVAFAASFLLLIGLFYRYETNRLKELSNTFQSISVPAGNRVNITLSDGTKVWLNAKSTLRYPLTFSKESRKVTLDGEGYFEVKKDKVPFIVNTGKYDIRVLGTTFDVEAYSNKNIFKTILYEGSVQLRGESDNSKVFMLKPGETAELLDGKMTIAPTSDKNSYRWKDGLIYIEDKGFDEIMEIFDKVYDVKIVINTNKVKNLRYRGKLRISDGVDHALRVLQKGFPFKYTRDEDNNIIHIN